MDPSGSEVRMSYVIGRATYNSSSIVEIFFFFFFFFEFDEVKINIFGCITVK